MNRLTEQELVVIRAAGAGWLTEETLVRLLDEHQALRDLLYECAQTIGPPSDHSPTSDDGYYGLAVRLQKLLGLKDEPVAPAPPPIARRCVKARIVGRRQRPPMVVEEADER